jgi:mRNA interferase RelE/StbE
MKISFAKKFNQQLQEINDKKLALVILEIIKNVEYAKAPHEIISIKKLKGHKTAFRIRQGNYRIGIFIENGEVLFAAIGLRKNIYKKFP